MEPEEEIEDSPQPRTYVIPSEVLRKILSLAKPVMSLRPKGPSAPCLQILTFGATAIHPRASLVIPIELPPIDLILPIQTVGSLLRLIKGYDGDISVIDDHPMYMVSFKNMEVSIPTLMSEDPAVEFPAGLNLVPFPPSLLSDLKVVEFARGNDFTRHPKFCGVWLIDGHYYASDVYNAIRKTIPIKWELSAPLFLSSHILPMLHSLKLTPAKVGMDDDSVWIVFEEGAFLRLPIEDSQKRRIPTFQDEFRPESLGEKEVDVSSWKDSSILLRQLRRAIPKENTIHITIKEDIMELLEVRRGYPNSKFEITTTIPIKAKGKTPVEFRVHSGKFFEGLSRFSRFSVYPNRIQFLDGAPDEDYIIAISRSKGSTD
jgi:hypothetical protein